MSRGPDNAGGEVAKGGPFVGSRYAFNNLYGRGETRSDHLPKKILSPLILVADGTPSAIADLFMLPFDWNGSTVPPANPNRTRSGEGRSRLERRVEQSGLTR